MSKPSKVNVNGQLTDLSDLAKIIMTLRSWEKMVASL